MALQSLLNLRTHLHEYIKNNLVYVRIHIRQKYYAPQIWTNQISNPWLSDHGEQFHVPAYVHLIHWAIRDFISV